MNKAIRRRLAGDEGFTLIELMVVVMIIAVLIAIAIPSFLGFRKSAQDRSAQSELRSVLLVEKAVWLETGNYTEVAATITALEPNTKLNADSTLGVLVDEVNGAAGAEDVVCMTRTSQGGTVFGVYESSTDGTFFGKTAPATCLPAAEPAGYVKAGW